MELSRPQTPTLDDDGSIVELSTMLQRSKGLARLLAADEADFSPIKLPVCGKPSQQGASVLLGARRPMIVKPITFSGSSMSFEGSVEPPSPCNLLPNGMSPKTAASDLIVSPIVRPAPPSTADVTHLPPLSLRQVEGGSPLSARDRSGSFRASARSSPSFVHTPAIPPLARGFSLHSDGSSPAASSPLASNYHIQGRPNRPSRNRALSEFDAK